MATSGAPSPSGRPDIGGSGSPRPTTTRPGGAAAVPTLLDFARSGIAKSDFGKSGFVESSFVVLSFVELSFPGSGLVKSDLPDPDFATSDLPGCGLDNSGLSKSGLDKSGLEKSGLDASGLTGPGFAAAGMDELGLDEFGLGEVGRVELGLGAVGLNEPGCDRPDLGSSNSPKSSLDKSNLAALLIGPAPGGGLDLSPFRLELSGAVCGGRPPVTRWRAVVASARSVLAAGRKDSAPFAGCSADLPNVGPVPDEPRGLAGSRPLPSGGVLPEFTA